MWLNFLAASKVKYFILAEIHEWLHKTGLKKNITSSTKCLVPSLTFAIGVNSTPSSTQRSSMSYLHLPLFYPKILMSYLHLPFFLLHIAVLPLSFQDSILTYTQLYPLCSSFHWAFEQALPFTANHFPFYWSYLLLNLQFSGWAWHPSLWRNTLPTSFQNSKYCSLSKPYHIASYLFIGQPSTHLPSTLQTLTKEFCSVHCLIPNV